MLNIRSRHINDETTKLTKRYLNEYKKIVKLMQQTILQKKKTNRSRCKNNCRIHYFRF